MVYKKYGEVFKRIRKQQGFAISDFTSIGIPKSTLSDFECGKTMMSLEKVDSALQRMGSGLAQFDNYLNNYITADTVLLLEEAEEAYFKDDRKKLEELLTISEQQQYRVVYSAIKIILGRQEVQDISRTTTFLFDAQTWGHAELYIYYIIMDFLDNNEILKIYDNFKKNSNGICESRIFNREIVLALCRASNVLAYRGYKSDSLKIIKYMEKQKMTEDRMFLRMLLYGTKGVWIYHFLNKDEGREKIKFFLDIQKKLSPSEIYMYFNKLYQKYINIIQPE